MPFAEMEAHAGSTEYMEDEPLKLRGGDKG